MLFDQAEICPKILSLVDLGTKSQHPGSEIESFCLPFEGHMFSNLVKTSSIVGAPGSQDVSGCPTELAI